MGESGNVFLKAVIIVLLASLTGLGVNLVSPRGIPWIHEPPRDMVLADVKVPLIDEKQAHNLYLQDNALFIDARREEDYEDGHVKGALSLPATEAEDRIPVMEPILSKERPIILYCSGPECSMAEEVALFLVQLGFKNLHIMRSGYPAWKRAGFPVEEN